MMEVEGGVEDVVRAAKVGGDEDEDLVEVESKNFSAAEYLNKIFPNEESLGGLDEFLVKLR